MWDWGWLAEWDVVVVPEVWSSGVSAEPNVDPLPSMYSWCRADAEYLSSGGSLPPVEAAISALCSIGHVLCICSRIKE